MVSCKQSHRTNVLGTNDSWRLVWWPRIVLSLLVVTLPLTVLVLLPKSKSDCDNVTCSFRILYMKVRWHIPRRSSRDSTRSWLSREVTLMSLLYWLEIQRAALLWTLSSLSLFFPRWGSHMEQTYSRPDLTNLMYSYANLLRSCGPAFRFLLMNPTFVIFSVFHCCVFFSNFIALQSPFNSIQSLYPFKNHTGHFYKK